MAGKEQAQTRFAKDQLKAFVERIERLEEEKKAVSDDIRDVYAEAKGNGFDAKAIRTIVRMRKLDANERREQEAVLEVYMHALGMLGDTELGVAARRKAAGDIAADIRDKRGTDEPGAEADSAGDIAGPAVASDPVATDEPDVSMQPEPGQDILDIPPGLRRGHPDCVVSDAPTAQARGQPP